MPGGCPVPATALPAEPPQLGGLTRHEAAALAGVAPLNRDGGTLRGKRAAWGGRARVRGARYMAALAATRHNPAVRAFYGRRCAAGKPKKGALTACMRTLLTTLNTLRQHGTPWQDRPASAA